MTYRKDYRITLTGEFKLSALEAQLEVMNAMHNNILGGKRTLATEYASVALAA